MTLASFRGDETNPMAGAQNEPNPAVPGPAKTKPNRRAYRAPSEPNAMSDGWISQRLVANVAGAPRRTDRVLSGVPGRVPACGRGAPRRRPGPDPARDHPRTKTNP